MSLQADVAKRLLAPRLREAEAYAIKRSPLRFAPPRRREGEIEREIAFGNEGRCVHGKWPRLFALQASKVLGFNVPYCKKCA
jgi:hypothetical protein